MVVPIWRQLEILYIGNDWDWGVPSISFWLGLGFQADLVKGWGLPGAMTHSREPQEQEPFAGQEPIYEQRARVDQAGLDPDGPAGVAKADEGDWERRLVTSDHEESIGQMDSWFHFGPSSTTGFRDTTKTRMNSDATRAVAMETTSPCACADASTIADATLLGRRVRLNSATELHEKARRADARTYGSLSITKCCQHRPITPFLLRTNLNSTRPTRQGQPDDHPAESRGFAEDGRRRS